MTNEKLTIGIITGSTRAGRVSPQVASWVKEIADKRGDAHYEIVDILDYNLPFFGTTDGTEDGIARWKKKIASLDGFIFVVAEYNHSITSAFKNALDFEQAAWNNKAAGIVSYGGAGGTRATEHLRGICGELKIADVRTHPTLYLMEDFKEGQLNPRSYHENNITTMLNDVLAWTGALKTLR